MSSAPPLESGRHLLEDALAERVRADDQRAVMVLQRPCDDLRRRRGAASTSTTTGIGAGSRRRRRTAWSGCWVRPRVETITPLGMKMLAVSCASSTSPPPFWRRSSTIPRGPSRAGLSPPRAPGRARRARRRSTAHDAELDAVVGGDRRRDQRRGDDLPRHRHRPLRRPWFAPVSETSVPGGPG